MKSNITLPTQDIINCEAPIGCEASSISDMKDTEGKEPQNHFESIPTDKSLKKQEQSDINDERLAEIQAKICGDIRIDLSKVCGNYIEDIFDLSSNPETIKKALFDDRKPIKISLASYIKLPSSKQIFQFNLWFGFSKAPVIQDMPRRFINCPEIWVKRNLMDYPRMTEAVVKYISDTFKKVAPILDKNECLIQEDTLMEAILEKVIEEVRERELPDDTAGASQYMVKEIKNSDGKASKYACICGSENLKKLLVEIDSPYSSKEFLEYLDHWENGSLLKKNGNRRDYKFHSKDSKRWFCIQIKSKNS